MRIKAFTLYETLTVIVIIGVISAVMISTMRPSKIKEDALIEAGKAMYIQIDSATREMIAKDTNNYTLARVKNGASEYSIASSSNVSTLVNTSYKKRIKALRNYSLPSEYTNSVLRTRDSAAAAGATTKVSSFTGFKTKNDSYFAVKLNNGCGTDETTLYNPMMPSKRTQGNSCGLIFFDVNADIEPNLLGVDQYLVSLTLNGVR